MRFNLCFIYAADRVMGVTAASFIYAILLLQKRFPILLTFAGESGIACIGVWMSDADRIRKGSALSMMTGIWF